MEARLPATPAMRLAPMASTRGCSAANCTFTSGSRAMARRQAATAFLKGSVEGGGADPLLRLERISGQGDVDGRLGQLLAEAALVELGHEPALQLVAFVEEGEAEREAEVAEDLGILGPGDDGPGAHDGREIAVHEGVAREVGDADHLGDGV